MATTYLVKTVGGSPADSAGEVAGGAGGGDMVLISTTEMDGNNIVDITLPSGTYNNFYAILTNFATLIDNDIQSNPLQIQLGDGISLLNQVGDYKGFMINSGFVESDEITITEGKESISTASAITIHYDPSDNANGWTDKTSGWIKIFNAGDADMTGLRSVEGSLFGRRTYSADAQLLHTQVRAVAIFGQVTRLRIMFGGVPVGTVKLYGMV